jgi:hypothetical protein
VGAPGSSAQVMHAWRLAKAPAGRDRSRERPAARRRGRAPVALERQHSRRCGRARAQGGAHNGARGSVRTPERAPHVARKRTRAALEPADRRTRAVRARLRSQGGRPRRARRTDGQRCQSSHGSVLSTRRWLRAPRSAACSRGSPPSMAGARAAPSIVLASPSRSA